MAAERDSREALQRRAKDYHEAAVKADAAKDGLKDAVRGAVHVGGLSQAEAARVAGVTRMTVRSWLGKGGASAQH